MSSTYYLAIFSRGHDLVSAAKAYREGGFELVDAYTPFAVHGLDKAMGLKPSRMMAVALFWGLLGLSVGLLGQYWISAIDWPINIGGKPFNSMPAFMPVTFEVTVLFAGVGTVLTFLLRSRLLPGRKPAIKFDGVTHDRFVLVLNRDVGGFDDELAGQISADHQAIETVTRWSTP